MDEDYDVAIDVLTKHAQKLQEMTERNIQSEYVGWGIMDDIRAYQIERINKAIDVWKTYNAINKTSSASYSDIVSDGGMDPRNSYDKI